MKKIRSKLSLALLPVVVFPLLALGLHSMFLLERLSQENSAAQFKLLLRNSQAFLNASIKTNHANLAFLPQTSAVNRYISAENIEDKNSHLGPMVQLLFHQMMKSNPGILQIVLVNNKQEEELQAGDGIDPFSPISPTNKAVLKLMQSQAEKSYVDFIYSPELSQFVFKQVISFSNNNPELKAYNYQPEPNTLILTYSLSPLLDYIKAQEKISGYQLLLIDRIQEKTLDARYKNMPIENIKNSSEVNLNDTSFYIEKSNLTDGMALIAMIPKAIVTAPIDSIRWALIIWLVLSMTVLLFLCSWILGRVIVHPMEKLRRLMHQVAKQEIRHIPLLPPDDEMVELRNQFSLMLSRLEASQLELEHSAFMDPVTGLNNRGAFLQYLQKRVFQAKQEGSSFFMAQVKMHNLSGINNTFGSRTGDQALQLIAQVLMGLLKKYRLYDNAKVSLARIGSDEFAFIIPPPQKDNQPSAAQLCEQLARRVKTPMMVGNYELKLRFSAGIISYPEAGSRVEELMQSANQARHQASRYTGNYWYLLDGMIAAKLREDKWLESELSSAIQLQQLRVVFQPQYSLITKKIIGAEVLLRWHHPEFGMVPPDRFIPIAEHSSQILDIDLWVLNQACQCLAKLQELGFTEFHLAVNASATELSNPNYPKEVSRLLKHYNLSPALFGIEITETALVELDDVARNMVKTLKEIGVEIALDDFGTGYTSLNHLAALPLDILKIDKSYTDQLLENPKLVDSIIQLAEAFNLQVIAEGVETQAQLQELIKKGCHMAQGYLLSRPITQDALLTLLDESPDFEQWETHTDVNAESHGLMTQSRYPERSGL
ncbi:MAG: EAL domain-containing protein [Aeromonadaceae bacterium]|nr:EAL domain-containing protein [Aeromonadaceae bacterium]